MDLRGRVVSFVVRAPELFIAFGHRNSSRVQPSGTLVVLGLRFGGCTFQLKALRLAALRFRAWDRESIL